MYKTVVYIRVNGDIQCVAYLRAIRLQCDLSPTSHRLGLNVMLPYIVDKCLLPYKALSILVIQTRVFDYFTRQR